MNNIQTQSLGNIERLLFDNFTTLSTAPDGITRLRELIFQLAVQGKLGTQDPGDESAFKNLSLMRSERKSFINRGLIRKTKDLLPIVSDDVQFSIPSNWVWAIIDDIGKNEQNSIVDGPFGSNLLVSEYIENGEFPVISISNIDNGFDKDSIRYISKEKFETLKRSAVKPGDIIMAKIGSCGKCGYYPDNLSEGIIPANLLKVTVSEKLNRHFIFLFFKSPFFKQELDLITNVTAQPAFSVTNFKRLPIPLPPLAEQHRIVEKVNRLMALCDELEARQKQERAGCLKLGTASLAGLQNIESPEEFERLWAQVCDAFGLILDCPENVAVLRQTILQLAVKGKLRINQIDIKDEHPFAEVPDGWKKDVLANLVTRLTNGYVGPTRFIYVDSGIPYILARHLKNHKIIFDNRTYISEEFNQKNRKSILQKGDVLLVQSGDIGNTAVVDDDHVGHNCHALIVMTPIKEKLDGYYLSFFFSSIEGQTQTTKIQTGMTLKHLNCRDVKKMIVPLPPLAEQNRIVTKVDMLMTLCDQLEARLKDRAEVQERYANAVVKQVAGGVQ